MTDLPELAQPKPASSAIVERDGRYLLVRRANPPSADMYAFPGGRGEPGETPAETAVRELFEETGISARDPVLFATYDLKTLNEDGSLSSHFFLSVFRVETDSPFAGEAADDAAEIGWFLPEEVDALPAPDSVRDCIARLAAAHLTQAPDSSCCRHA
ncbi:NUDIX hydrolase [Pararhizobium sp.]|uniref:NUDIX hydrolase n=1 Tax=Pararhizobium sp. TaxID=1977563 RepID=UPI002716A6B6|nr:NUDIX domain-containing protein [Pararhizobium sp.]MDO9417523.1 NUDIX domain-containing protein [Pararhizobium sp.]